MHHFETERNAYADPEILPNDGGGGGGLGWV